MDKKIKRILIILIVCSAIALVGAGIVLGTRLSIAQKSDDDYKRLASSYASGISQSSSEGAAGADNNASNSDNNSSNGSNGSSGSSASGSGSGSGSSSGTSSNNPVDFKSLMELNPDVYAWLYIPNTNVNYPVCQSRITDDYYLDHDVYKNYCFPGALYSQLSNSRDFSDPVTVIYGHNMANKTMFGSLHNFENTSFFNSNPYIYVYTKDRKLTYQVISAMAYDNRHIMNSFNFRDESVFSDFISQITNPKTQPYNVNTSIKPTTDDNILVLSTCLNSGYGRYLVTGELISNESAE